MRIVAGTLGGRIFDAPKGHRTHPMSETVRGSLFNVLGDIAGQTLLDAFGGSGALALEAISRGASGAVIIEQDRAAAETIKQNADKLGVASKVKVIRANAAGWSANNPDTTFDLVLCDPPYDKLQLSTVEKLTRHLKTKGLMVLSHPGRGGQAPTVNGVVVVDNRSYGDAALSFYRIQSGD